MSENTPATDVSAKFRRVRYERWGGVWSSWEPTENSLLAFVYDYHTGVDACGVFPPFHLLNQFLLHGGGGGGMGPGARWEPFSISPEEYDVLTEAIRTVSPASIEGLSGVVPLPFTFDPEFDGDAESYPIYPGYKPRPAALRRRKTDLDDYFNWMAAVCGKHRDARHAAMRRAGKMV